MTRDAVDIEMWDREAETFDAEPDHGLADPKVRAAWRDLLLEVLPPAPARIADLGCGTGTLTRLLIDEGYSVDGLDFSPAMIARAEAKVPEARFVVGDAAQPELTEAAYDVVLCRHVLWALPEPESVVQRWSRLLAPGGVLVLIEGSWATGAGLTAREAQRIVGSARAEAEVTVLPDAVYWGKEINDERYLLVSRT